MRIAIHVVWWVLIWFWMTSVYLYDEADFFSFLIFNLMRLPIIIAATYAVSYFVVSKNIGTDRPTYTRAVIVFSGIFIATTLLDRGISSIPWMQPTLNGEPLEYRFINPIPMLKNAFILLSIIGFGAVVQFFVDSVRNQKQIFELREEKLGAELAFLKSQVNPHFLFNMFNNLFSMAERQGNKDLAKGLSNMAQLMQYLTYESNVPRVPVTKEIALLQSFIELQRIRMGEEDELLINFKTEGDFSTASIAPVMLLPLLENAFKHNISSDEPVWIDVLLKRQDHFLIFEIRNKKSKKRPASVGGVGLTNLRKRLEIIYPGKHELIIQDDGNIFDVRLSINLDTIA